MKTYEAVNSKTAKGMDVQIIAKNGESFVKTDDFTAKIISVSDKYTSDSYSLELVVELNGKKVATGLVSNPGIAKAFFFATAKNAHLVSFEVSEAEEHERVRETLGNGFSVEAENRDAVRGKDGFPLDFCYQYV